MKTEILGPWYVKRGDHVRGPLMRSEILESMSLGRIKRDDLVRSRQDKWEPISQVPWLVPEVLTKNISIGWVPA